VALQLFSVFQIAVGLIFDVSPRFLHSITDLFVNLPFSRAMESEVK
jgi:hypothetical protein